MGRTCQLIDPGPLVETKKTPGGKRRHPASSCPHETGRGNVGAAFARDFIRSQKSSGNGKTRAPFLGACLPSRQKGASSDINRFGGAKPLPSCKLDPRQQSFWEAVHQVSTWPTLGDFKGNQTHNAGGCWDYHPFKKTEAPFGFDHLCSLFE